MRDSIRLGQVRGITIRLHHSVLLILGLLLLLPGPSLPLVLAYVFLLVPIILLHELGHSVVAQHFGIRVVDITFWPLGGMARMSHIPEDSRIEGAIAIAGPLVNFGLAALGLPLLLLPSPVRELGLAFLWINLLLGGFNLLPAFPMDGGRVLRAWLGRRGDWLSATERAVRVGRFAALAMVVASFVLRNPMLALVALFVWWAGGQELMAVRMRHQGPPLWSFGPWQFFAPRGAGGARAAQASFEEARAEPEGEPRGATRASASRARRPVQEVPQRPEKGWSEADLELLERFRGSLRRTRDEL